MNQGFLSVKILKQLFFIALILLMCGIVFYNLATFIPGVLGALCLYVLLIKPMRWMMYRWRIPKLVAIFILMLVSVLIVITPLIFLINMLTNKVSHALENTTFIQEQLELALDKIHQQFGIDLLKEINLGDISAIVIKVIQAVLNTSVNGVVQIGVAYLLLYFMLANYKNMEHWFSNNIPLKKENLKVLNKDLRDLVVSNAVGIPAVAFLQALVAYVGYLIFGVDDAFSWFILTIFGAMLPVVGAAIIYVPASIYLLAKGDTTNAYLLLAYGFIVVGLTDNIFRFWLQKVMADVHPLITIFGVIVGVNLFGFIGIIFGPIFMSLTIWLFRIYKLEFSETDKSKQEMNEELPNN